MQKATAVIGGWYGDEGKGLITDYICSLDPTHTAVVRYNGGAQAGHTVCTPDGRRHVFSHFSSGSFLDVPTYLSKFFICNPTLFVKEWRELEEKGATPKVYIHPQSLVSTPWDVCINRALEGRREDKHGSVGVGINETLIRSAEFPLKVEDFRSILNVSNKVWSIKNEWWPRRLEELGFDIVIGDVEKLTENFMSDCRRFIKRFVMSSEAPTANHIVFEGAQGLMLDECRIDQFPHTTPSRTGLPNVLHLCKSWGIKELEAVYVSRTYVTRHGDGPLPGEISSEKALYKGWGCKTNTANNWQRHLRFANLDWTALARSMRLDLAHAAGSGITVSPTLAWTHCDQYPYPGSISVRRADWKYFSYKPTRKDVIVRNQIYKAALKERSK